MKRNESLPNLLGSTILAIALALAAAAAPPAHARNVCGDGTVTGDEECDDGNAADGDCCSSDCRYANDGNPCDTTDVCYETGICDDGECVGDDEITCDDGNPCTTDYCNSDAGGCQATAVAGCCQEASDCDDGIVCNGEEVCQIPSLGTFGWCTAGTTTVPCNDGDSCTRDQCVVAERGCVSTLDPSTPGCLVIDADHDAVWDRLDKCPNTPLGAPVGSDGCSVGDMAENAGGLVSQTDAELQKLTEGMLADEELAKERKLAMKMRKFLERGAITFAAGNSCKASKFFVKAEKTTEKLYFSLDQRRRNSYLRPVRIITPGAPPSDHTPADSEAAYYELASQMVQRAVSPFLLSSQIVSVICQAAIVDTRTATVTAVDTRTGRLMLSDGMIVRAGNIAVTGGLAPGATINLVGERVTGAEIVARTIYIPGGIKLYPPVFDFTQCFEVQVAPVQPEENLDGTPELYPFKGFRFEGTPSTDRVWLERGMAMYIKQTCTPPDAVADASGKYLRYYATIQMATKAFLSNTTTYGGALDLEGGEWWKLPDQLNGQGDMTVEWYTVDCMLSGGCTYSTKKLRRKETRKISVTSMGGYCRAEYDETEFELPDRDPMFDDDPESITFGQLYNKFKPATVVDILGFIKLMGGTQQFSAQGYAVSTPTVSSYPDLETIGLHDEFAIYPTRDPVWLSEDDDEGVDRPAGLAWPSVSGTRNGGGYRYACTVPAVVRDVVDFCDDNPRSYYRLPWKPGAEIECGQANDSGFTHCGEGYPYKCGQKYAFDFSVPNGGQVIAARGGEVIGVRSNAKSSCSSGTACTEEQYFCCVESSGGGICTAGDPAKLGNVCHASSACDSASPGGDGLCVCAANIVSILHADGSVGQYFHFQEDEVEVEVGDRVYRGDLLGKAGNTGCSTNPHLHFHVIGKAGAGDAWQKATQLVRFAHKDGTCVTPAYKSKYKSNNYDWLAIDD